MSKPMVAVLAFVAIILCHMTQAENEVESAFNAGEIVPDVIKVAPQEFLEVFYENGLKAEAGNELTPTQVKNQPIVEWNADEGKFYTLIMTDPDAPSRNDPSSREFLHWMVVNIPGNNINQGDVLAAYVGSGPPKNSGLHRYVFLLYEQKQKINFNLSPIENNSRRGRPKFRAAIFANKFDLGSPIAGNFYQAQWDEYVPILHRQLSGN